jgi:acylphosphatase
MTHVDASEGRRTVRYRVHGRVQGVGFRWWTRQRATELALTGQVENCSDGSVEVVATGPIDALRRMRRLLKEGPPNAVVERVEEFPASASGLDGFTIA